MDEIINVISRIERKLNKLEKRVKSLIALNEFLEIQSRRAAQHRVQRTGPAPRKSKALR